MTIRTVTVSGVTAVNFDPENKNPYFFASEKYAWIKNNSDAAMYVSLDENCTAGATGTAMISSGECGRIELSPANALYISGSGSAEIRTGDTAECPFKVQAGGGDLKVDLTCTALASGWSNTVPYTQTVSVSGITSTLNPLIDVVISNTVETGLEEEQQFSYITKATTNTNSITFYCYKTKPTIDLNIMIEVV